MMTVIVSPPLPALAEPVPRTDLGQRFVLNNITWQQYVTISDALPERGGLRLTFDRGRLEFMTTSPLHEKYKVWFGRFFDILAEEAELPAMPGGQTTFRAEELAQGIEPDHCYWIAHERQVRAIRQWLPDRDPPPDLALEIEISRNIIDRLPILAALRVPEDWCFDGTEIRIYVLGAHGQYQIAERSPTFPKLNLAELVPFFQRSEIEDPLTVIRACRAWVREQLNAA